MDWNALQDYKANERRNRQTEGVAVAREDISLAETKKRELEKIQGEVVDGSLPVHNVNKKESNEPDATKKESVESEYSKEKTSAVAISKTDMGTEADGDEGSQAVLPDPLRRHEALVPETQPGAQRVRGNRVGSSQSLFSEEPSSLSLKSHDPPHLANAVLVDDDEVERLREELARERSKLRRRENMSVVNADDVELVDPNKESQKSGDQDKSRRRQFWIWTAVVSVVVVGAVAIGVGVALGGQNKGETAIKTTTKDMSATVAPTEEGTDFSDFVLCEEECPFYNENASCIKSLSEFMDAVDVLYTFDGRSCEDTVNALSPYGSHKIGSWCFPDVTDLSNLLDADRNEGLFCFDQDVTQWDVSNVRVFNNIFQGLDINQDLSKWNTSNALSFNGMFESTYFNQPIGSWKVSKAQSFDLMFAYSDFNQDISAWDMAGATTLNDMFNNARSFDQPVGAWKTSSVTSIHGTFFQATNFNQDLSGWDVSRVEFTHDCFSGASSFNGDISSWDVSGAQVMGRMFLGASAFNVDIGQWDVSNVYWTDEMFSGATAFHQDISNWRVSANENMHGMFSGAWSFDQNISDWDVSNVVNFERMFQNAIQFNQELSPWFPSSGEDFSFMFEGATNFRQNLCAWGQKIRWDATVADMFVGTNCPDTSDPDLFRIPPGPFCFPCD